MVAKPFHLIAALLISAVPLTINAFAADPLKTQKNRRGVPPLPRTQNPHTLLGFDWLTPPADFDLVHKAYRKMARLYHPDAAVGPDATDEEREAANHDFRRINEAYEKLKAREGEETFEMIVMGNGKVEKKYYTTSEEWRKNDPDRVNFQRIFEIREKFPNAKTKSWSDGKYKHPQGGRHNGDFGPIRR
ncbi:hypothetical protein ACHAXN_010505 [Cyclotella atomus]